jgi:hypothetical protein
VTIRVTTILTPTAKFGIQSSFSFALPGNAFFKIRCLRLPPRRSAEQSEDEETFHAHL